MLAQAAAKRGQRVVEPPARRRAQWPAPLAHPVENVNRDDRAALGHRRVERQVVLEAKVVTKPEENWAGLHAAEKGTLRVPRVFAIVEVWPSVPWERPKSPVEPSWAQSACGPKSLSRAFG